MLEFSEHTMDLKTPQPGIDGLLELLRSKVPYGMLFR